MYLMLNIQFEFNIQQQVSIIMHWKEGKMLFLESTDFEQQKKIETKNN